MSELTVEQRVKDVIARDAMIDRATITNEKKLESDLGVDSFDVVMIEQGLEDEFGIEVSQGDFTGASTVMEVVYYVERMIGVHQPV